MVTGHPSIRWLLRKLGNHIKLSASLYQSNNNDLLLLKQYTANFLNEASTEGFISSQMWSTLYDLSMDLIQNYRSVDIDYVSGILEGSLQTMFPHDEF